MTVIRPHWIASALALLIALGAPLADRPLRADTGAERKADPAVGGLTPADPGYYLDASALLIYGTLGSVIAVSLFMEPAAQPLLFSPDEGGAEYKGDTLPSWTVAVFAGATLGVIAAADTDSRWYHTKGALGAFSTTLLLTDLAKNIFARHRPDYDPAHPEAGVPDGRKSFFSGHSSLTVVSTTYLAWYLKNDLFPGLRGPDGRARWWEVASYLALAGTTVGVPLSRVLDNRHNPGDVAVGSLVGASLATGFYFWHRHSARKALGTGAELDRVTGKQPGRHQEQYPQRRVLLMPSPALAGASLTVQF